MVFRGVVPVEAPTEVRQHNSGDDYLRHLFWEQRAGGSNPSAPTNNSFKIREMLAQGQEHLPSPLPPCR
jgi:hypothetical protein